MRKTDKIFRLSFYGREECVLFELFGYKAKGSCTNSLGDYNVGEICDRNPKVWVATIETDVRADFEYDPDRCRRWILPDESFENSVCEVVHIYDIDNIPGDSYEEIWWRDPDAWINEY